MFSSFILFSQYKIIFFFSSNIYILVHSNIIYGRNTFYDIVIIVELIILSIEIKHKKVI